jgi:(5-formylfuran-3-yl)methyl phosphate synthase
MRLLVSVRSAAEARAALQGGADIIDAKDPSRGPLGPVSAGALAEIAEAVPQNCQVSVALGDFSAAQDVVRAVSSLELQARIQPVYLKIGLAGASHSAAVESVLAAVAACGARRPGTFSVIAVGYADWEIAASIPPGSLYQAAANAGCSGVLLDTYSKAGADLLDWIDLSELDRWVSQLRRVGLLSALSGGLDPMRLPLAASVGPDVIGVRGAACEGGRSGTVSTARVMALRSAVIEASASLQGALESRSAELAKRGNGGRFSSGAIG